jgi:hypothetical protein
MAPFYLHEENGVERGPGTVLAAELPLAKLRAELAKEIWNNFSDV